MNSDDERAWESPGPWELEVEEGEITEDVERDANAKGNRCIFYVA